jgi:hypothetical protein
MFLPEQATRSGVDRPLPLRELSTGMPRQDVI